MICLCPTWITCEWTCFHWQLNVVWTLSGFCSTGHCFWLWRKRSGFKAILSFLDFQLIFGTEIYEHKQNWPLNSLDWLLLTEFMANAFWIWCYKGIHCNFQFSRQSWCASSVVSCIWKKIPCPRTNNGKLWSAFQKRFLTPRVLGLHWWNINTLIFSSVFCAEPIYFFCISGIADGIWHSSAISAGCCGWCSCIGFACRFAVLTYDRLAIRVVQTVKRLYYYRLHSDTIR